MVSKKKRPLSLEVEVTESAGKKMRLSDGASTSHNVTSVTNKSSRSIIGGSRGKKSQDARETIVKTEVDDDDDGNDDAGQTHHTNQSNVGESKCLLLACELKYTCWV
jgi:hypothetical protein